MAKNLRVIIIVALIAYATSKNITAETDVTVVIDIADNDPQLQYVSSFRRKVNSFTDAYGFGYTTLYVPKRHNKVSGVNEKNVNIVDIPKLGNISELEVRHYYVDSIHLLKISYALDHKKKLEKFFGKVLSNWTELNDGEFNRLLNSIKIGIVLDVSAKDPVEGLHSHKRETANQVYEKYTAVDGHYIGTLKDGSNVIWSTNTSAAEESLKIELYTAIKNEYIRIEVVQPFSELGVLYFEKSDGKWNETTEDKFIGSVRKHNENVELDINIKKDTTGIIYFPPQQNDKMSIERWHVLPGYDATTIKDSGILIWNDGIYYCNEVVLYKENDKTILLAHAYDDVNKPKIIMKNKIKQKWGKERRQWLNFAHYFNNVFPHHLDIILNTFKRVADFIFNLVDVFTDSRWEKHFSPEKQKAEGKASTTLETTIPELNSKLEKKQADVVLNAHKSDPKSSNVVETGESTGNRVAYAHKNEEKTTEAVTKAKITAPKSTEN